MDSPIPIGEAFQHSLNNWAAGKFLRLEPTELDAKRRRLLTYRFTVNG